MSNGAGHYELYLAVGGGADEEKLDQSRRTLQRERNELEGINKIEQLSGGKAPENARAIDLVAIGGESEAKQGNRFVPSIGPGAFHLVSR